MIRTRSVIPDIALITLILVAACASERGETKGQAETQDLDISNLPAKALLVRWQRLVDESGQTCNRCGLTEAQVQEAVDLLSRSLEPLGIDVLLDEKELSPAECATDISQSNRIWIGDLSLEDWLGAKVGDSPCAGCCEHLKGALESKERSSSAGQ